MIPVVHASMLQTQRIVDYVVTITIELANSAALQGSATQVQTSQYGTERNCAVHSASCF